MHIINVYKLGIWKGVGSLIKIIVLFIYLFLFLHDRSIHNYTKSINIELCVCFFIPKQAEKKRAIRTDSLDSLNVYIHYHTLLQIIAMLFFLLKMVHFH
jgi:hypothetical protein